MKKMIQKVANLFDRESGATIPEYAFMLAFIALACVLAIGALGSACAGSFADVQNGLSESLK